MHIKVLTEVKSGVKRLSIGCFCLLTRSNSATFALLYLQFDVANHTFVPCHEALTLHRIVPKPNVCLMLRT
jgi:hypothetical protein